MAYASRSGRASTSSTNPRAFAVCQRCSMWVNHDTLAWQMQYGGAGLINTRIMVCPHCVDVPQPQLKALALPPDPVPIQFALTEPFLYDATEGQTTPYGVPVGLEQYAISPMGVNPATGQYQAYGVAVPALSVVSNGTTTVAVSCSAAHGLATDDQVSASGLSDSLADGFYSVSVTGGVTFQYETLNAVPAGSLLAPHSLIVTVLVGLPRGETTITQVG